MRMSTASDERAAASGAVAGDGGGAVTLDLGTPNPRQAEFLRSNVKENFAKMPYNAGIQI